MTATKHPGRKPAPNVFVFWGYDQFPYVLGSAALMNDDGTFSVPAYNIRLTRQKVVAIYPPKMGEQISARLELARKSYEEDCRTMLLEAVDTAKRILPELVQVKGLPK